MPSTERRKGTGRYWDLLVDEQLAPGADLVPYSRDHALVRWGGLGLVLCLFVVPAMFWQTHRGTIINTRYLLGVVRESDGTMQAVLRDRDERLPMSQPYHHLFRQM